MSKHLNRGDKLSQCHPPVRDVCERDLERCWEKADGVQGKHTDEKAALVNSEAGLGQDSPKIDPLLLDYAQRLSEEIVARAVQQWAEVDSRYSDIPYIDQMNRIQESLHTHPLFLLSPRCV
ncbi:hypothetical protein JZ751_027867 [Albula glossodonta]|uniref:Small membrane A-kinase anchor protein n=1 Tax=Albula glossodonta TaxID=121402 RepID=A0A8T2P9X4_9TELE|nr:hypothetical protein JZ751_027867 [Albula glossodonta]